MKAIWTVFGIVAFMTVCACQLPAQGTKADYDRAAALRRNVEGKVLMSKIRPQWFSDNSGFWYRNDLEGGKKEYVRVDIARGVRDPAFDHSKLAKGLSAAVGHAIQPDQLSLDRLAYGKDGVLSFKAESKGWKFDPASGKVAAAELSGTNKSELVMQARQRPSRASSDETYMVFINQTTNEVKLVWVNTDGERVSYGKIAPGAQHRQHTFSGHFWGITDASDKWLGGFEATNDEGTALINGKAPAPESAASNRPRNRRRSGNKSPDKEWTAFVKENNLWIRNIKSEQEFALSQDGSGDDAYGNEIYWSPDSKKLVAVRVKKAQEHKVYLVESSPKDQLQPKLHTLDYLKPGDKIAQSRPFLFDVVTRKGVPVSNDLFSNPWSIGDFRWMPDSSKFTFVYNQRGHQVMRVLSVRAESGEVTPIINEECKTFFDYSGKSYSHYMDETGELIWMTERDGWNHLYLYDLRTGKLKNQITKGEWVVRGVDRVDEAGLQIWFRAGGIRPGQDPYYIHYCRLNFDGTGLVILTEGDGTHTVEYSPDRATFIDTWSRVDQPPVHELRRSSNGQLICALEKAEWSGLLKTGWTVPERFVSKGRDGKTDIYGIIIRPGNFDPQKKYPVIEEIYAGPQGAFVPKAFGTQTRQHSIAELGFIVVQMDGMGTSYRSKAFHDVCWKNLGDSGFPDRIAWMKAAAAKYPQMDLTRVGIYGGSAGGQNTLRGLLAHGDFYKAGVADCGCHDNRMDKIWWNEQWMGWPIGPHYEEQSNVTQAHRLSGKLMLVVGEMDNNVDPASTMQVVNALIKADKDFDLLVVPGGGHGIAESPYGSRRRMDFFVRHLLGVEPRSK